MEEQRITGRIVKISEKGFGFILSPDIPFTRIFFHWTSLVQNTLKFPELRRGMLAEFTRKDVGDKGTRAIKIKIVDTKPHPLTEEEEHAAEAE
jgi:cold shock CspA family protein